MFSYLKLHLHNTYRKHLIVIFICSSHHWKKNYISQVSCSMFTFYENLSSYHNRYVHYYLKNVLLFATFWKSRRKLSYHWTLGALSDYRNGWIQPFWYSQVFTLICLLPVIPNTHCLTDTGLEVQGYLNLVQSWKNWYTLWHLQLS